jgi:CheY-like chemotaxis protein
MDAIRVLVTDDDPVSLMLIEQVLKSLPVQCLTASSVVEAVRIINSTPPQVAILDVQLPDGDGTQILLELKAKEVASAVAFITASLLDFPFHKCASHQPDMLFAKPLDPQAIRSWVQTVTRTRELAAA